MCFNPSIYLGGKSTTGKQPTTQQKQWQQQQQEEAKKLEFKAHGNLTVGQNVLCIVNGQPDTFQTGLVFITQGFIDFGQSCHSFFEIGNLSVQAKNNTTRCQ